MSLIIGDALWLCPSPMYTNQRCAQSCISDESVIQDTMRLHPLCGCVLDEAFSRSEIECLVQKLACANTSLLKLVLLFLVCVQCTIFFFCCLDRWLDISSGAATSRMANWPCMMLNVCFLRHFVVKLYVYSCRRLSGVFPSRNLLCHAMRLWFLTVFIFPRNSE
jgi:hypothetical protein